MHIVYMLEMHVLHQKVVQIDTKFEIMLVYMLEMEF